MPASLRLQHRLADDRHTISILGELDLAGCPELLRAARRLLAEGAPCLVVDLDAVTFMDSSGLRGILGIQTLCAAAGCGFAVTPGKAQVQRLFEVAGVLDLLPLCDQPLDARPVDHETVVPRRPQDPSAREDLRSLSA